MLTESVAYSSLMTSNIMIQILMDGVSPRPARIPGISETVVMWSIMLM